MVEFECPEGTVGSEVKIVQPKGTALTICGVEVYGQPNKKDDKDDKKDDDKDKKDPRPKKRKEVLLEPTTSSESDVAPQYPWRASKLIQYAGNPVTNVWGHWNTQTCTHSKGGNGEKWQQVGFEDTMEVTRVKLIGRSDCCQKRNWGNYVYAGKTLCGRWPRAKKDKWVEFKCPDGTLAKDIRVVKRNKGPLTLCGVEVYGYRLGVSTDMGVSQSFELTTESNEDNTVKSTMDTFNETSEDIIKAEDTISNYKVSNEIGKWDLSYESGWRAWSNYLGAYKIHMKENMKQPKDVPELKFGSFIEIWGKSNKDKGLDFKWSTTNGFKLKVIAQRFFEENDNDASAGGNTHIMLKVLQQDSDIKKSF